MNAGELKAKIKKLEERGAWTRGFGYAGITVLLFFFFFGLIPWMAMIIAGRPQPSFIASFPSILCLGVGLVLISTAFNREKQSRFLQENLKEYGAKWQELQWTPEKFLNNTKEMLHDKNACRFAALLVAQSGLGPYSNIELRRAHEASQRPEDNLKLFDGMLCLLFNGFLVRRYIMSDERVGMAVVRTPVPRTTWSPGIHDRLSLLDPMPEDFDPNLWERIGPKNKLVHIGISE